MMDNLRFEIFDSKKNLEEQRRLFKDCFPETDGDPIQGKEHYMWKFHSFPIEGDKSWEYATYIGDEMVGYYAAIPYRYKIGNIHTSVGMVCDVMTSSHHRGQGIFTKLGRYSTGELANHVPITMGYPIRKPVIPGHLKVGWKIAYEMPLYMKFLKFNSILASKHVGFLAYVMNPFLSIYNWVVKIGGDKSFVCKVFTRIGDVEGYSDLVEKWRKELPNTLDKNLDFSRWRYGAPNRNYFFIGSYNKSGVLVGFSACRYVIRESVPSLCILDYIVLKNYRSCLGSIMSRLTSLAKEMGAEVLMTMMSRVSASNYQLIRSGFIMSPFKFYLIIKNLNNKLADDELYDERKWHLMWVDCDDL